MPDPMEDLRQSLERFAEVFVATVAKQLKAELDALTVRYAGPAVTGQAGPAPWTGLKLPGKCPDTREHPRHVWRFPDSDQARQCPGVATPRLSEFPEERCQKTDPHVAHHWEYEPEATTAVVLGRRCPGLESRQCPDNLAHHVHTWFLSPHVAGPCNRETIGAVEYGCPGLELDREVQWCASRPDDHAAHEWTQEDTLPTVFCKGFREVPVKRCLTGKFHDPHNWEDPITGTQACPGRTISGIPAS